MANKVALIDNEYAALKTKLNNVHADCFEQIETIVNEIEKLNTDGGGFYAEKLTPQISALIKELDAVKSGMDSVFIEHEQIIESFQRVVDDYDTLG